MPVEFACPSCSKVLRVPDENAGGQAKCPACDCVVDVPAAGGGGQQWHIQAPSGEHYGPVGKAELDRWVDDGRLTAEFRIRSEGSDQWQPAPRLYPSLLGETTATGPTGYVQPASDDPYESPTTAAGNAGAAYRPYQKAHRGGTILTYAIIGILCCFPFSIAAWVMGSTDLAEMKAGRMDNSGEGMTRAGQIIGIIEVVILVLAVLGVPLGTLFRG